MEEFHAVILPNGKVVVETIHRFQDTRNAYDDRSEAWRRYQQIPNREFHRPEDCKRAGGRVARIQISVID